MVSHGAVHILIIIETANRCLSITFDKVAVADTDTIFYSHARKNTRTPTLCFMVWKVNFRRVFRLIDDLTSQLNFKSTRLYNLQQQMERMVNWIFGSLSLPIAVRWMLQFFIYNFQPLTFINTKYEFVRLLVFSSIRYEIPSESERSSQYKCYCAVSLRTMNAFAHGRSTWKFGFYFLLLRKTISKYFREHDKDLFSEFSLSCMRKWESNPVREMISSYFHAHF